MKVPFKINNPQISLQDALIYHTDYAAHYTEINSSSSFAAVEATLKQAIRLYIIPFISKAYYDEITSKYHADTLDESEEEVFELLQTTSAYYREMYVYAKKIDRSSDAGNFQATPERVGTGLGMFKSKLLDLTLTADMHLDLLLAAIEREVAASNTLFDTYKFSSEYSAQRADLFRSVEEVQRYHNINSNRRIYLAMLPYFADAARLYVLPQIGQDMYNELVQQYNDNVLTSNNAVLLEYVRHTLIKFAMMCASDADAFSVEGDAIRIVSNTEGFDRREAAIAERRRSNQSFRIKMENVGNQYLSDLAAFLKAKKDLYPTFNQNFDINDNVNASKIVVTRDKYGDVVGGIGIF